MFRTRLLSGIVLVLIALVFILSGGDILLAGLGIVSLIGLFELYRVFHIEKKAAGVAGYLLTALFFCNLKWHFIPDMLMFAVGSLILFLAVYVFTYPGYRTEQILAAFFGLFYVGVMLSFVYQSRMMAGGAYLVWLIFLCSWGCDTCAYCVGVLIGKHKMTPKLSPKKSWEGAVGGVVGTALLTLIYGFAFRDAMGLSQKEIFVLAAICALCAIISMIGDLAASAIKRNYEIKDYGRLIPGHGGIMDRFDSVIFTAPAVYFLAEYLL